MYQLAVDCTTIDELYVYILREKIRVVELFRLFDANRDGEISRDEFKSCLIKLGIGAFDPARIDAEANRFGAVSYAVMCSPAARTVRLTPPPRRRTDTA